MLEYEAWLDWCDTPESRKLGIVPDQINVLALDGYFVLPDPGAYQSLKEKILKDLTDRKFNYINKLISISEELIKECLDQSCSLGANPSISQLIKTFELMARLRFPWMACIAVGEAADSYLKIYAEKQINI